MVKYVGKIVVPYSRARVWDLMADWYDAQKLPLAFPLFRETPELLLWPGLPRSDSNTSIPSLLYVAYRFCSSK
jgi:hypothetical protein